MNNLVVSLLIRARDISRGAVDSARAGISSLVGANNSLSTSTAQATTAQDRQNTSTATLSDRVGSATRKVVALGAAYLGLNKLKEGFLSILATGGKFETLKVQLNSVMGTVESGEAAFAWIQEFAKKTPLQLDGVTSAFVKMKALGLDPMDGTMQKLTDISSKLGGGQERLEGIILAVGQAWTKGKLQAEEANQLIERGVPVWDLMSKAIGVTTGELQDMASKGKLGRAEIKLLIDEIGKSSEGAAQAQMSTWAGVISNLQDTWTTFLNSIAESGALDYFKEQLTVLSDEIKILAADGTLKIWAKDIADGMIAIGSAIKSTIVFISDYKGLIVALGESYAAVKVAGFIAGLASTATAMVTTTAATSAATVAATGFGAALRLNPITAFIGGMVLLVKGTEAVIQSFADKKAANDDLIAAQQELIESDLAYKKSVYAQIEADKKAKKSKNDYTKEVVLATEKGREQAKQQAFLATESGKAATALITLGKAQKSLTDKTGNTAEAIKKLSNEAIAGLLKNIDEVNKVEMFAGNGWDDLKEGLLHERFNRLGIDLDVVTGKATNVGINGAQAFKAFAGDVNNSKQSVAALASKLIDMAKTKGDIDLLTQSFADVGFEAAKHPQLITAIVDKIKSIQGNLKGIPQQWIAIAKATKDAKNKTDEYGESISQAAKQQEKFNSILEYEQKILDARAAKKAAEDKAEQERRDKQSARVEVREYSNVAKDQLSQLTAQNKDEFERLASQLHVREQQFGIAAPKLEDLIDQIYQKQQKKQQRSANKTINVNFKANGKQSSASFSSQQEANRFLDILKTAGSVS